MSLVESFETQRTRLLGLGYRMLGSRAEAEDVVQDAWLRWSAEDRAGVEDPAAFLVRVTTRLCLDRVKSAHHRRTVYVGPWLPEPVLDPDQLSPHATTELADDLSYALLLALDRLSASERAAFLLHDVFDISFAEVAATLERSEQACRQLASRARRAVRREQPVTASRSQHRELLERFMAAAQTGEVAALEDLLCKDVVAISDGGGKVAAALNPIRGTDRVVRFFAGILRQQDESDVSRTVVEHEFNGQPGLFVYLDGQLDNVLTLKTRGHRISALYIVRNPEKLAHCR